MAGKSQPALLACQSGTGYDPLKPVAEMGKWYWPCFVTAWKLFTCFCLLGKASCDVVGIAS